MTATPTATDTIWIDVPDGRLAAEDLGPRDGAPILLVHSAIVNRRAWDGVVPHLTGAGYRVLTYDLRGYGDSLAQEVDYAAHEDLIAVLDHFGVSQAAVVGNSMGAVFAMDAVLAAPARFAAYVWVAGGIGGFDKEPTGAELALFDAEEAAEEAGDANLAAELDTRIWVDGWKDGENLPSTRVDPTVRAAIREWDVELVSPTHVYAKRQRPERPAIERLEEIAIPTLVVIGELDTVGTRAAGELVAERVPGARVVRLPDVAHIIGMEAPDRLVALILEHLAPLPRWG
ncbi:MAG TPA: alpha/beta hydrolase [Candidatus Limnocylindria bacterium]|nr:alpha/beta hydrolase [Candidatus Limnocylindria bacterium]